MGSIETSNMAKEKISMLVDGELSTAEAEEILSRLYDSHDRKTWDLYHQIGDILRSDEMDVPLSKGFESKMQSLLDAEPPIVTPLIAASESKLAASHKVLKWHVKPVKKFVVSGMAAAAAVAFVAINLYQKENAQSGVVSVVASAAPETNGNLALVSEEQMPVLDNYMLAHRRFSPSFYGSAQYVRLPVTSSDD